MGSDNFSDGQLARAIFLQYLAAMKEVLKLGEFKIGKGTEEYRYFKKVVMDQFYNPMSAIFAAMEKEGLIKKCSCGKSLRHGYDSCPTCNGSGYCNTDDFADFVADQRAKKLLPDKSE